MLVIDIIKIFNQILLVLKDILLPFITRNVGAETVEARINDIVDFLYSYNPVL